MIIDKEQAILAREKWVKEQQAKAQKTDNRQNTPSAISKKVLAANTKQGLISRAEEFLRSPDLVDKVIEDVHALGVAGEDDLILAVYLIGISRLLIRPLAGLVMSDSSSGKSFVISKVASLFPEETVISAHRLSPRALERMPDDSLIHRFIVAGERSKLQNDAAAEATRALREMLSDGKLTAAIAAQTGSGNWETVRIEKEGPISYVESTTLGIKEILDEDRTRFILLSADESQQQTQVVVEHQAEIAENPVKIEQQKSVVELHHTAQRLLEPCEVVIPFARELTKCMPVNRIEIRRTFGHMLGLIQSLAVLNQFKRDKDDDGRILADVADWNIVRRYFATTLAKSIGCGLTNGASRALDIIREMTLGFTVQEIAMKLRCCENTARSRIKELIEARQVFIQQEGIGRLPTHYQPVDNPPPLHGFDLPELGSEKEFRSGSAEHKS